MHYAEVLPAFANVHHQDCPEASSVASPAPASHLRSCRSFVCYNKQPVYAQHACSYRLDAICNNPFNSTAVLPEWNRLPQTQVYSAMSRRLINKFCCAQSVLLHLPHLIFRSLLFMAHYLLAHLILLEYIIIRLNLLLPRKLFTGILLKHQTCIYPP